MKARKSALAVAVAVAVPTALGVSLTPAGATRQPPPGPTVIEADHFGISPAVRDLRPGDSRVVPSRPVPRVNPLTGSGASATRGETADPLAGGPVVRGRTALPGLVFNGTTNPAGCGACTPPDTTGDVGPNHYIQLVNETKVAIYNKSGTLLTPIFNLSSLGACGTENGGDPQVNWDGLANRWVLSQLASTTNRLCFAVSQTPNPTGSYFTYSFTTPRVPDYFKVGVWPTGYYVGTNENTYTAYALDRTKMLAGDPTATAIRFPGETNFLMPANVEGTTAPDPQGGLFYTFKDDTFHGGSDRLQVFRLTPNFAVPANSTFGSIATIPISSFTYTVCGFFKSDCIPQPGTDQGLDALSEWPMQHLAYRRFADHEALVGNFTVDAGGDRAGIRWFELRNTGAGYSLFQEGTQAPADGLNRWMGSIAMNSAGDIALGYSVSSDSVFPSIRYVTRAPTDPPGTFGSEQTLMAGGGSQTSTDNRWGDYSAMAVDPSNNCDFWYTNEYYSATATTAWKTAIGRFDGPACEKRLALSTAGTGSGFVDSSPAGIDCGQPVAGHSDCTESYSNPTAVTLTAHPASDSDFAGFSGGGCAGSTTTCVVNVSNPTSVTATFTLKAPPPPAPPSNVFTIDKVDRNTKNGTAKMMVTVPGPGELALSGKLVKSQRPPARSAQRRVAKPVSSAGSVELKVKPKGKARKKLKKKGKTKVKVDVTYTPTGGTSATQSRKIKLQGKPKK
jgi:hypothetical protein